MSVNKGIYFDEKERALLLTNGERGSYIKPSNDDWNRFYINARHNYFYWPIKLKNPKENWEALGPLDIMVWSE